MSLSAPKIETIEYSFPPKPAVLSDAEKAQYKARIKQLLIDQNAVLVAHYYTDPEIQALAEETGGVFLILWKWHVLVAITLQKH